ncbi:MAG: tetratricopeptide repeat protein [Prolixibacteraceae bacterium]|nr:tetratricopeptide repeat protein [Prolixibacteraceae bacterium]
MTNTKANEAFAQGNYSATLKHIARILESDPVHIDALLLRAKVNFKLQNWQQALNDLTIILEKQPGNEVARNYKSMVMEILNFWHKENYNP